jgi:transposase
MQIAPCYSPVLQLIYANKKTYKNGWLSNRPTATKWKLGEDTRLYVDWGFDVI